MAVANSLDRIKDLGDKAWEQLHSWCFEHEGWKDSFTKEEVAVSKYALFLLNATPGA
jgi:hypothetical protein